MLNSISEMDPESIKISYHRLSTSSEGPAAEATVSSPSLQVAPKSSTSGDAISHQPTSRKSLPTPTIIEELQATAQRSSSVSYPLFTRYLPNDIGLAACNQHQVGFLSAPLLLTQDGREQGFEQRCRTGFLGGADGLFKYSRIKSGFTSHRFLCAPLTISPSEAGYTSIHRSWPFLKQGCFLAFFTCVVVTLCLLIGLLISTSFNPCPDRHKWFQGAIFYEIFPASFQDTDGDGFGDFRGIARRLDYIKDLGVKAIRLNSVFSALDYPLEYEHIIDLRNVDPHLGRLRDFKDMVREAHKKGIRVVLELNPTVTSDQHTWALHWQRGIDGYQHFYASANRSKAPPEMEDKGGPPPESWELTQRTFGGHYVVNWSNPSVQREYLRTINFWVEAGVDGFYMKHLENLNVLDVADIKTVVSQWRQELDRFRLWASNRDKALITSIKFVERLQESPDNPSSVLELFDLIDVPVIFDSNYSEELSTTLTKVMGSWWKGMPGSPWVMWHFGSADNFRFANRVDAKYREALLYSVLMLPGSASVFYGDEIGLVDSFDIFNGNVYRGGQFAPMQWTSDNFTAGFTDNSSEPWLPLTQSQRNVRTQHQLLQRFIRFANIHNVHSWNRKNRFYTPDPELFVLERPDSEEYQLLFYANLGQNVVSRNFSKPFREVNVLASTANMAEIRWNAKNYTLNTGDAFVAEVHV